MPNALTRPQLEALRRIRDFGSPFTGPPLPDLPREIGFLFAIELVCIGESGAFALTELGQRYLDAADVEMAGGAMPATGALGASRPSSDGS